MLLKMFDILLFMGAGAGAGEKNRIWSQPKTDRLRNTDPDPYYLIRIRIRNTSEDRFCQIRIRNIQEDVFNRLEGRMRDIISNMDQANLLCSLRIRNTSYDVGTGTVRLHPDPWAD